MKLFLNSFFYIFSFLIVLNCFVEESFAGYNDYRNFVKKDHINYKKSYIDELLGDKYLVKTNLETSKIIFDRQENVTNKTLKLLEARQKGLLKDKSLYVGGRFIASHMREWTNIAGKFPIISRIPNQHTSGKNGHESVINDGSVNITATYDNFTAFVQGEYTEVEYPGQDQRQLRKYYLTLGDLAESPFYAAFGRKTVAFGNFASYAPITHNHSSHYFWTQTDKPLFELGYSQNDLNLTATLMANDRGLRVASAPDSSGYENFAFNYSQKFDFNNDYQLEIGAGFLRGTIYDSTLAHHPPVSGLQDKDWNSAWNVNATLSWRDFDFMFEFSRTIDDWPATNWEVSALTAQARYKTELFDKPTNYSFMFSRGEQGDRGEEWEHMIQAVVGVESQVLPNVEIGAEYLYNKGFVPLILPQITGDRDVEAHTILGNIQITF